MGRRGGVARDCADLTFFALNAASFFLSALFISRIAEREAGAIARIDAPRIREAFDAILRFPQSRSARSCSALP